MHESIRLGHDAWEPEHVREERRAAERKAQAEKDTVSRLLQSVNDARETLLATRMRLFLDGYDAFGRPRQPTAEDPVDPMADHAGLFAALAALREREQNRIEHDELMARLDLVYLRAMARSNFNSAIRTVELQAKLSGLMPGRATKAEARLLAEAEAVETPAAEPAAAATGDAPSDRPSPSLRPERSEEPESGATGTLPPAPEACGRADDDGDRPAAMPAPAPADAEAPAPDAPPASDAAAPSVRTARHDPGIAVPAPKPAQPPAPQEYVRPTTWPHYRPPGR